MKEKKAETVVSQQPQAEKKVVYVYEEKKAKKKGFPLKLNITILIFSVLTLILFAIPFFVGEAGGAMSTIGAEGSSLYSFIFDFKGAGAAVTLIIGLLFGSEIIIYVMLALLIAVFVASLLDVILCILLFIKPIRGTFVVTLQKVMLMIFGILQFIAFLALVFFEIVLISQGGLETAMLVGGIPFMIMIATQLVQFILKLSAFARTSRARKVVVEETK